MIHSDAATIWPVDAKKTVMRNIPFSRERVVLKETSDGTNCFTHAIPSTCQLVISYYYPKKVFVVWNGVVHSLIHDPRGMTKLTIGSDAKALIEAGFDENRIECTYKSVKQRGTKNCVELITIVGRNALYDFCKSYEDYIIPRLTNIPRNKMCLYAVPGGELQKISSNQATSILAVEREREGISRAKRDPVFRMKVIERWGGRCIVCGTKERRILEAAHIESVKEGGSDDPLNGYCLCANHHRMYDSGILNINLTTNCFECTSEESKKMPWYKEAKKREFKLFLPNQKKEDVAHV